MKINSNLVKQLREKTGSGIMNCKQALVECDGDIQSAVKYLKKKGQASAQKRTSKIAREGLIHIVSDDKHYAMIDCNCETDSVAKLDDFVNYVQQTAQIILNGDYSTVDELLSATMESGKSIQETQINLIATIGENIVIRRFMKIAKTAASCHYLHDKRIGVITCLEGGNEEAAKNISMHIAASSPLYYSSDAIPESTIKQEKEIAIAQLKESSKPENIIEKIAQGKVQKWVKDICLLSQTYIKDDKLSVESYLKNHGAVVVNYQRFQIGEGIAEKQDDFATEVYRQIEMTNK